MQSLVVIFRQFLSRRFVFSAPKKPAERRKLEQPQRATTPSPVRTRRSPAGRERDRFNFFRTTEGVTTIAAWKTTRVTTPKAIYRCGIAVCLQSVSIFASANQQRRPYHARLSAILTYCVREKENGGGTFTRCRRKFFRRMSKRQWIGKISHFLKTSTSTPKSFHCQ